MGKVDVDGAAVEAIAEAVSFSEQVRARVEQIALDALDGVEEILKFGTEDARRAVASSMFTAMMKNVAEPSGDDSSRKDTRDAMERVKDSFWPT
jgi:predicted polyphosphate/ATP-dependent NAD kinase